MINKTLLNIIKDRKEANFPGQPAARHSEGREIIQHLSGEFSRLQSKKKILRDVKPVKE